MPGATIVHPQSTEFVDPWLKMMNKDILPLDVNVDRVTKRLEWLTQLRGGGQVVG